MHHQFLRFSQQGTSYQFRNPSIWSVISSPSLHKDSGPSHSMTEIPGGPAKHLPQQPYYRRAQGRCGPACPEDYSGPHWSRICSEPEKVRTSSHTGSCVHRGIVPDRPGETVPTGDMNQCTDRLCKILFQRWGIQTSSSIPGFAGADGSNTTCSGICPPLHASHPVVLDNHRLRHPIFVSKNLVHVLLWSWDRRHLSQGMLFMSLNTTITITTDASIEGWGGHCIVPGSGTALYSDLWTKDECQLHVNVLRAQSRLPDPPAFRAERPQPNDFD